MLIENSANERYLRTLNIGSFPSDVLVFQESQDFFQQLIFIDYQLQLLLQNEFGRNEFKTAKQMEYQGNKTVREKLTQLIDYVHSITLNYGNSTNSYDEKLYYSVLMAHLYYLNSQISEMNQILNSVTVPVNFTFDPNATQNQNEFVQYLNCRYHVLLGLTNVDSAYKIWFDYLLHFSLPLSKSNVLANYWLDILFSKLANKLTQNGLEPLSFTKNVKSIKFYPNSIATICFSQFLLRPENARLINDTFRTGYNQFVLEQLEGRISNKTPFPEASSYNKELDDYVANLYESLSRIANYQTVLKPTLSKKFLTNSISKTYQSQTVLSNLIKTLIDLNEYDEAFAAFRTYISYLEAEQEQNEGHINNILLIIDIYSKCILSFNPLKSIIPHSKIKKFKYTTEDRILSCLPEFIESLKKYLDKLTEFGELSYDVEGETDSNPLSFLYRKYNVNMLQSDNSQFIELVSRAWYSIGYYHYYLSVYGSASEDLLQTNISNVIKYYKNALIINSTGNGHYLFDYALALSNTNQLKPALKLCKFILKKFPESFKTWNLLVLIQTALEVNDPDSNKEAIPSRSFDDADDEEEAQENGFKFQNTKSNAVIEEEDDNQLSEENKKELEIQPKLTESEIFANNALNIAGLVILRHQQRETKLSIESRYEILQLKLTQLAVWESVHGVQYILDYLPEIFITYHELFDNIEIEPTPIPTSNSHHNDKVLTTTSKWSHRPSFIDPSPSAAPSSATTNVSSSNGTATAATSGTVSPSTLISSTISNSGAVASSIIDKNKALIDKNKEKLNSGVDKIKRMSILNNNRKESIDSPRVSSSASTAIAPRPSTSIAPKRTVNTANSKPAGAVDNIIERKILQDLWLWAAKIFLKIGLFTETEQCIVEAETIYEPNYKTFSSLGHLTSKNRKFLSLQEYERSLEILATKFPYNKAEFGDTLLGLCKLFLIDDKISNSLFISNKDVDAGKIRLKNLLENFQLSWPYGYNNVEAWYYLSKIYESIDDKLLLRKSLWKCVELEDNRPVRSFSVCDSYNY